jgi:hypothetical protein
VLYIDNVLIFVHGLIFTIGCLFQIAQAAVKKLRSISAQTDDVTPTCVSGETDDVTSTCVSGATDDVILTSDETKTDTTVEPRDGAWPQTGPIDMNISGEEIFEISNPYHWENFLFSDSDDDIVPPMATMNPLRSNSASSSTGSEESWDTADDSDGEEMDRDFRRHALFDPPMIDVGIGDALWITGRAVAHILRTVVHSPSRLILILTWGIYSCAVLLVSSAFWPYMILYSLLFAMILYTEAIHYMPRDAHGFIL